MYFFTKKYTVVRRRKKKEKNTNDPENCEKADFGENIPTNYTFQHHSR